MFQLLFIRFQKFFTPEPFRSLHGKWLKNARRSGNESRCESKKHKEQHRDKLVRSFLRSHEAARVVSGQAGGKSPFEAARSPLIAIWRFTFIHSRKSADESTARENRKSPRGGWPRGEGGGESPAEGSWRGLKRVVVCRVAISRARLPSTPFIFFFFLFTFLRCDRSHGRISSCSMMVGAKYLAERARERIFLVK